MRAAAHRAEMWAACAAETGGLGAFLQEGLTESQTQDDFALTGWPSASLSRQSPTCSARRGMRWKRPRGRAQLVFPAELTQPFPRASPCGAGSEPVPLARLPAARFEARVHFVVAVCRAPRGDSSSALRWPQSRGSARRPRCKGGKSTKGTKKESPFSP